MFQLFKTPSIDFMARRKFGYAISLVLIVLSIGALLQKRANTGDPLNYGIDFRGGSQFQIRFAEHPDPGTLREQLKAAGFGDVVLQPFGEVGENSVLIRVSEDLQENPELVSQIRLALRDDAGRASEEAGHLDLNTAGVAEIEGFLQQNAGGGVDPTLDPVYREVGEKILAARALQPNGLFATMADLEASVDIDGASLAALEKETMLGTLVFERTESVGPVVGEDLRSKAVFASLVANGLILLYLSVRFEVRFGVSAVITLVHDLLFVLGVFAVTNREVDLTVLASMLTVIGYSVNDTIVVFDRIRGNLKLMRKKPIVDVINSSINQTLARTVLTSGSTLMVIIPLYLWGGAVLNNFAFALMVGVGIGTYSSIFVASPVLMLWQRYVAKTA